ncbi:Uncharacterised protein [Mycobacterium tuberculosis]|nr:Uncharacterised protein [Mycobacterium tuberculosis]
MRSVKNTRHEPSSQAMWWATNSSTCSSAAVRTTVIRNGASRESSKGAQNSR